MGFEFLPSVGALGWGILRYLIAFLFVLTVVVFFHELGHFLVARWYGVRVLVFSIGFGPELFGFNDRKGTRWKVSAIPLGGYVKFFGDENAASVPDQSRAGCHDRSRAQGQLHPSESRTARRDRGGRPAGQFHSGDRDLRRCGDDLRPAKHAAARGFGAARTARRRRPGSSPATSCCRSMAERSAASPRCSASSASAPARRSPSLSIAAARR